MGDEQPPPPPTPQQSAPVPPAPAAPDAKRIELTVKSMMEGVPEQKLVVSPEATVLDVKNAIAERTDIAADRQMLLHNFVELKHDSSPLSEYGILQNTTLTLQLRLASGSKKLSAPQLMILTPASFEAGTLNELRSILMGKKPKAAKKAARTTAAANDSWTPEKQMEHQVTRNRMKELMKKRKSTRRHEMDTDSVIGTPVKSPAGAPTDLLSQLQAAASQLGGPVESLTDVSGGFSSRELKLFYDPPETLQENLARRGDFYDPPTTMKELVELKERLVEESKTKCRVCKKRLPLSEQAMLCRCGRAFCATHRGAEEHQCDVDYKHTGRKKLLKENPKVDGGGARKAKTEEA